MGVLGMGTLALHQWGLTAWGLGDIGMADHVDGESLMMQNKEGLVSLPGFWALQASGCRMRAGAGADASRWLTQLGEDGMVVAEEFPTRCSGS